MADFWDFLGGAAQNALQQRNEQRTDVRELERQKALEALRRDTSDYEYNRGRADAVKQVDVRQSYLDPAKKEYVMVNSEGQVVGRRAATESELNADEGARLKLEEARADIAYKKKLTANVGLDRSMSGAVSRRGTGLDGEESGKGKLSALAASVISNLRRYNLPQRFIAQAEARLRNDIVTGKADEAYIRRFEALYLADPRVNKALEAATYKAAAEETLPALND
jgi:hypothetical protein